MAGRGGQGQQQGDEKTKRIMAEVEQVKEVMQDNVSKITRYLKISDIEFKQIKSKKR
jgi:hypothetical protein